MTGIRTIEDIRLRCVVDDITGCWLWKGAVAKTTPTMRVTHLENSVGAGVAICFLKTGKTPAKGVVWHRTCRTSTCVCPDHRQEGTRGEQMAFLRGQSISPDHRARIIATRRAQSRLSQAAAEDIRTSEATGKSLAIKHGISISHACRIKRQEDRARVDGSVFGWRP